MKFALTMVCLAAIILSCGKTDQNKEQEPPQSMVEPGSTQETDPMSNKGIGPVSSISLGAIDQNMVEEGKTIYQEYCTACHKPNEKFIGPAPAGILARRSPEWIMNMILNPEQMVKEDPIARQLLVEYNMAPMANQGLTEEQARKILEYFRTLE